SVTEIAKAFVTGYDTIEKRLYRARQSFREHNVSFDLPPDAELQERLSNVLMAIYLLFNEGYNSTQHEDLIRNDLITESMRLCELICRSDKVKNFGAHALMALICFTAARNDARLDAEGNILLLKEQDRSRWNRELIAKGIHHLDQTGDSDTISRYHFEAVIAYEHAAAPDYASTKWASILHYYDLLLRFHPSPVTALNRAIVVGELHGPAACIKAIHSIEQVDSLKNYYILPATLGEMHRQLHEYETANRYFEEAIRLTRSATEKKLLQQKITLR
ncbi:MAG TPA: hypothetical protein PLZ45_16040, partial [Ferruginibacter sp.]|nr:hypothetical protein [Ferruginibacter sp.]